MKSITETIIFCGCQALSLHGLRHDPQFYNTSLLELPSVNVWNFLELSRFRVAAGRVIKFFKKQTFKKHLVFLLCKVHTQSYTKWINLFVRWRNCHWHYFRCERVKSFFYLGRDEVRDCSNTEQMSFVMRYVDKSCQIREEFIQFLECESGTSGHAGTLFENC